MQFHEDHREKMIGKSWKKRLVFTAVTLLIFCNQTFAFADVYKYVRVSYTTIDKPVVQTTAGATEVNFSLHASYAEGPLLPEDLDCIHFDGTRFRPELKTIGADEYLIVCRFQIKADAQSGLQHVYIGTNYLKPSNYFTFIPSNAINFRDLKGKDSFGQTTTTRTLNYESLINYAMIFGADIAVNPPASYKYPELPILNGETVIFDSKYSPKGKLKVILDKSKKTFSFSCPNPYVPSNLSKQTKYSRTLITMNEKSNVYDSDTLSTMKLSYALKPYKGQTVAFTCAKFAQVGQTYVSYYESQVVVVKFP